jgi:glycine oxidase
MAIDDCLILGGGVIGLSLAYELSQHGWHVRVLDRGAVGREASWAGAGILPPAVYCGDQHPLDQLRGISHNLHRDWAAALRDETGIDTGYRRCGGVYLARSAGETALLSGMARQFTAENIACERLAAADLRKLEPALAEIADSGQLKAAYLVPDESQLRNPRHLQALRTACARRGVAIVEHVHVSRPLIAGGRVRSVPTDAGEFQADHVCITAGAWSQMLLGELGIANGILPIRGQMVLFHCPQPPFTRVLNEGPRYLVPRDDGHVLAGSSEEEAGFDKSTTADVIADLKNFACEMVPALRQAPVAATWAGLRPGSFDGFPYLGKVPGMENLYVAAGHFRSGLHLSPGTAVVISELLRGLPPRVDLSPFRVGRG